MCGRHGGVGRGDGADRWLRRPRSRSGPPSALVLRAQPCAVIRGSTKTTKIEHYDPLSMAPTPANDSQHCGTPLVAPSGGATLDEVVCAGYAIRAADRTREAPSERLDAAMPLIGYAVGTDFIVWPRRILHEPDLTRRARVFDSLVRRLSRASREPRPTLLSSPAGALVVLVGSGQAVVTPALTSWR